MTFLTSHDHGNCELCDEQDALIERLRGALEIVVPALHHAERAAPFNELPGDYRVDALEIGEKALTDTGRK